MTARRIGVRRRQSDQQRVGLRDRLLLQPVSDGQISHDGDAELTKMVGRTYA
jgi:hypothetical protein